MFCKFNSNNQVESIVEICSKSFPDSLRWKYKSFSRIWWKRLLHSQNSEVWLYKIGSDYAGFIHLVIDVQEFYKYKKSIQSNFVYLYGSITSLSFLILFIKKLFNLKSERDSNIHMSFMISENKNNNACLELIAVSPEMRQSGIGTQLVEFAKKRTIELGFGRLTLTVKKNNNTARRLYSNLYFN